MESQGAGVGAGAGWERCRVVQHLLREPWKSQSRARCWLGHVQGGSAPGEGAMEEPGDKVGAGAGLERHRVVQHLLREPWKNQWTREGADEELDIYRVVQPLEREPCKG